MSDEELKQQYEDEIDYLSDYRKTLIDTELKISDSLDKAILAVSSAALGFCITLIKSHDINLSSNVILTIGLFGFCTSIISVILSQIISGIICSDYINQIDRKVKNRIDLLTVLGTSTQVAVESGDVQSPNFKVNLNKFFHYLGAISLAASILLFSISMTSNSKATTDENTIKTTNSTQTTDNKQSTIGKPNSSSSSTSTTTKETNKKIVAQEVSIKEQPITKDTSITNNQHIENKE